MPLFRITVKSLKNSNGVRLERGMSVDIVSRSFSNPLTVDRGQAVVDAFLRIYNVDIRRAGALSTVYLSVDQVG